MQRWASKSSSKRKVAAATAQEAQETAMRVRAEEREKKEAAASLGRGMRKAAAGPSALGAGKEEQGEMADLLPICAPRANDE